MDIQELRKGAVTVIKPTGALIADDADRLKRVMTDAGAASLGRVVLDASGIPFVDSRGIEALLDVSDELGQAGRALKLSAATATLREALELTGVAESMEFYDDVQTAVRSFL
jgi:anti-anti-sigma factor